MKSTDKSPPSRRRELFLQALEKTDLEERRAFLDAACGEDTILRESVNELLAHHRGDCFLEESPAGRAFTLDDPAPPAELSGEAIGDRIGRYKLLQKVGEGGCGIVYMAEQEEPVRRRVALKVIKLGMDTKSVIARFEAERQALAMMDHPNIAKVLDAGATESGRPYFVMELVRGVKITDYSDQHHLPTRDRLELFIKVCQAIQHAHQKGIIHRDIKPSNILVTLHDGVAVPKVIDFGIAKATTDQRLTDKTLFTALEQFVGTPAYMSPEQAEMSGLDIDTRSDIYSLGVLLYELLTGKTPFDTQEFLSLGLDAMRRTIREQEPVRPSTRLSAMLNVELTTTAKNRQSDPLTLIHLLRGDVDWIVMKCLEKDRARRYETANGLASDVQRHLNNETVLARPPSATYRVQKLVRRNKGVFAAIAAVLAALLVGILASVREAVRTKWAEHEARRQLYVSDMIVANKVLSEGRIRAVEELLDGHDPQSGSREDLRGFEYYYLRQQCVGERCFTFPPQPSKLFALAYSPDGKVLATGSSYLENKDYSGELKLFDVNSRREIHKFILLGPDGTPISDGIRAAAFSPDGKLLASGSVDGVVTVWDAVTHKRLDSFFRKEGRIVRVTFSPDGRLLASIHAGGIAFWDTVTRKETNFFKLPFQASYGLAFSPDGKGVAFAQAQPDSRIALRIWNFESQSVAVETVLPFEGDIYCLDFSHDSKTVAFGLSSGFVGLWEINSQRPIKLGGHQNEVITAAFSADGRHLVTGSADSTIKLWDAISRKEVRLLRGHRDRVEQVVFSPDGSHVASASRDKTVKLWPVAPIELDVLRGHAKEVTAVEFSPDGRLLATASGEDNVKIWDSRTRELSRTINGITNGIHSVVFSPDGKNLAGRCYDGSIKLWETGTWQEMTTLSNVVAKEQGTHGLRYSADGKFLVAAQTSFAVLWEVGSWRAITNLVGAAVSTAFSPDNRVLALAGSHPTVQIWESGTWKMLKTLVEESGPWTSETPRVITALAFAPDGRTLVSGSQDSMIRIWDVASGQARILRGQAGKVMALAISPLDGKTLASSDTSGGIKLWNLATGKELFTLGGHESSVRTLTFSPDGTTLASGSSDTTVRLWSAISRK